ncbi:RAMP superfamily CRISPR-associated protein [Oceanivirga salmonicida]|uniref:RAMP superfamily CRISPR-associated protein n=1 Tax=Oceanivirga salmonicida TaxID=1769291 RepID=UPI0018CC1E5C|nr:RAMP superfamily CRISPR-associated protein [Oceanivirga salmonicida]
MGNNKRKVSNKDERCYYFYEHPSFSEEKIKKHLMERSGKLESGIITAEIEIITPLYTEGQKKVIKGRIDSRHENKEQNNLSVTTLKSQIRRTMELIDLNSAGVIFGTTVNASLVNFLIKFNDNDEKAIEFLKTPKNYEKVIEQEKNRVYYNQLNRIKKDSITYNEKINDFEKSLNLQTNKYVWIKKYYKPGTKIKVTIRFKNLLRKEIELLVHTLELENGLYHQIGYGKNYGMGTIKIRVDSVKLSNANKFNTFFEDYYNLEILDEIRDKIKNERIEFNELSVPDKEKVRNTYMESNPKMELSDIYAKNRGIKKR